MIAQQTQPADPPPLVYPIPRRISLKDALHLIEEFLTERAGGYRLKSITAALFEAVGKHFGSYTQVRRTKATAGNTPAGTAAQFECLAPGGKVVLAVEAQHRELTLAQLQSRLPSLRENRVSEAFFITTRGIRPDDADEVQALLDREFVSGQNIYVSELLPLCEVLLALLGEGGRRMFLECVCAQLQEHSDIHHRRAWAHLLGTV